MPVQLDLDPSKHRHVLHAYAEDADLIETASDFLATGIARGHAAIVIATPIHATAFRAALSASGVDVAAAERNQRLVVLDAEQTLSSLMVDGRPDASAFDSVIGDLVRSMHHAGLTPVAYGEMVALLWEAGNVLATIELEELWNGLIEAEAFSLLCAYPSSVIDGRSAQVFGRVCGLHTQTFGTDSIMATSNGHALEATRAFAGTPEAPREARRFAAATLEAWGRDWIVEEVIAVLSELASNAVRHAGTDFVVTISSGEGKVRVAVRDKSPAPPQMDSRPSMATSGRGLFLVEKLSRNWGAETIDGTGKVVWAEFPDGKR